MLIFRTLSETIPRAMPSPLILGESRQGLYGEAISHPHVSAALLMMTTVVVGTRATTEHPGDVRDHIPVPRAPPQGVLGR